MQPLTHLTLTDDSPTAPDTSLPDTSVPDTSVPDTSMPDTSMPDTSMPVRMVVRPWFDPGLALRGVDPRSDYVERYFSGLVGPSVVLITRRFARGLSEHPEGFSIATADTARAIGLGAGLGPNAPMARTLERAALFGFLRRVGPDLIEVRTHLPLLTQRQLRRLPQSVRASHENWISARRADPPPAA